MNYLLDFLRSQGVEKPDVPSSKALTKLTKPPSEGEIPARPLLQGTDKTDETPPTTSAGGFGQPPVIDGIDIVTPSRERMREAVSEVLSNPGQEPEDWPIGWWDDFDVLKAEHIAMGEIPGEAARLAYEHLKARARGMGLATGDAPRLETWTDPAYDDIDFDTDLRDLIVP